MIDSNINNLIIKNNHFNKNENSNKINENDESNKNNKDKPLILDDIDIFGENPFSRSNKRISHQRPLNIKNKPNEQNEDVINLQKLFKFFMKISQIKLNLIGKNLKVYYLIDEILPSKILFDERKLKQIIFNLLSNAMKFTNQGKIGIEVDYNKETKNLVFKIIDSGIGIGPEVIEKIGQPYFKTFYNNNDYGIGMGIFLVKNINKSLNGVFKIELSKNKGTTIIVEFPYNLQEAKKSLDDYETNFLIKLNKLKSRQNSNNFKTPIFQEKSEDHIKSKIDLNNDVNLSKKSSSKNSYKKRIQKKRRRSCMVKFVPTYVRKSVPNYDLRNADNQILLENIKNNLKLIASCIIFRR